MAGVDEAGGLPGVRVFHAGTRRGARGLETSGGRVVAVTAVGAELQGATRAAYAGAARIRFPGARYRGDIARRCLDAPLRVGVLGSTRGTSLQAVLDAAAGGTLANVSLACCLSNKADAPILERCAKAGVPAECLKAAKGEDRAAYGERVTAALERHGVDVVLCVGWMRIFSDAFCRRWRGRCLNARAPSGLFEDFFKGVGFMPASSVT